jgi:uncharacterized integral membrane protein
VIIGVIVACEVGFWVVLAAALLARYALRLPRVSAVLLVCVPLVDLVLLAATVIDLRGGAQATAAHGMAAAYLGFSVAFGHRTIAAIDQRVAHRFAGAPSPDEVPPTSGDPIRQAWQQWRRAAAGWAVACALLVAAIALVNNGTRTAELTFWLWALSAGLAIWLVTGPVLAHLRRLRHLRDHRRSVRGPAPSMLGSCGAPEVGNHRSN